MRKQTSGIGDITFSIVKVIDNTNKNTSVYFKMNDELSDFNNGRVQRISEGDTRKETRTPGRQKQHATRSNGRISKKP